MKNTLTSMSITRSILNTSLIDNDSFQNGITIPIIPTFTNSKEYDCIYNILKESVTDSKKGAKNLDLVIAAKTGHNIYNYDQEYDFYFGSSICTKNDNVYAIMIADISDEEKVMLQDIIWKRRNIRKTLHNRVADTIRDRLTEENLILFVDGFDGESYRAVFTRPAGGYGIAVLVKDASRRDSDIQLIQLGVS